MKKLTEVQREHNNEIKAAIKYLESNSKELAKEITAEEKKYKAHEDDAEWMRIYGDCPKAMCENLRKEITWNYFRTRELKKELY